jgi:hypothetical protein
VLNNTWNAFFRLADQPPAYHQDIVGGTAVRHDILRQRATDVRLAIGAHRIPRPTFVTSRLVAAMSVNPLFSEEQPTHATRSPSRAVTLFRF